MISTTDRRRAVWGIATRSVVGVAALLAAYLVIPLDLHADALVRLLAGVVGVAAFIGLFWHQVKGIQTSPYPMLRAAQAAAMVGMAFVVMVALTHVAMSEQNPSAYTEGLSRLDGLYFTITVLATVGFGDIAPVSPPARLFTMLQMLFGLVLLGVGIRALQSVASSTREARERAAAATPPLRDGG